MRTAQLLAGSRSPLPGVGFCYLIFQLSSQYTPDRDLRVTQLTALPSKAAAVGRLWNDLMPPEMSVRHFYSGFEALRW